MESLGSATAAFTHVVLNPVGKVYFARSKSSSSRRAKRICFGARIWHHRATRCCSLVFPRRADSVRERLSGQRFPTAHAAVEREVFAFAANGKDFDDSANGGGRGGDDRGGRNDRRPDGDGSEESHAFLTHLAALVYCALARASGASANYMHASLFGTALLATQLEESRRIRYYGSGSMIDPAAFVGDSQRPVVILLSWLGAQHRHMSKYAEWYRARGYDVVTLFNGLQTALIPTFSRRQALRLLHLIDEIPENRPIVVHSFSIGTGIYGYMLDFIHRGQYITEEMGRKMHRQIRGVIFDSGPGHMHASSLARGLYSACPKVGYRIWNAVAEGLFRFLNVAEGFRAAEHALQNVQLPSAPQLYLYSLDDAVVNDLDKSVRQYIEAQKQRGLEVYHKVWERSQHATHFKVHPEEYKAQVESFLRRALIDVEDGMRGMLGKLQDVATGAPATSNTTVSAASP